MLTMFARKWQLSFRVMPVVLIILLLKFAAHHYNLEFLSPSPLVGAIISANVFLVGFLISGVLGDYKESEKLPGELACSLDVLIDESSIVYMNKKSPEAKALLAHVDVILASIVKWLHKDIRTAELLATVSALNAHFLAFEPLTQANFIVRMKQEQNNLRKTITRIHTIRETSFNPAGYAIAEIISTVLCLGLIFTNINPYHESVFFVAFVSFILIYMVFLIKNLDNPFSHYEKESLIDSVSLRPLHDLGTRLKASQMD